MLKAFPKKIESSTDAKNVFGLGEGMLSKIQEILNTGTLQRTESMGVISYFLSLHSFLILKKNTDQMKVLEMFDEIHGVGPATALQFYNKGFRTINDLRKNTHLLNEAQKVPLSREPLNLLIFLRLELNIMKNLSKKFQESL